ncbi:MAG: hypothetical protein ABS949_13320 [Solibacillus sp.]
MLILYNAIFFGIIASGIFLMIKGSSKKSFFLICLGINITVMPISLFIGIMATDAPDSNAFDFLKGFLFIQAIPIILFIISTLKSLFNLKVQKKNNIS